MASENIEDKSGEAQKDLTFNDLMFGMFPNPLENRRSNFLDELVFRKAKVYKINGIDDNNEHVKDDRIKVQVFPELAKIKDEDFDNLPEYPPFFKGTYEPFEKDEWVWVICTPDCQTGYILGGINQFQTDKDAERCAYNFDYIKDFLTKRECCPNNFDYQNIVVVFANMTDKGGLCEMYNKKTGDWFLLNSTGTMVMVQQGRIFMRVGSPANPEDKKVAFSSMDMTTGSTIFTTPLFKVQADRVELGDAQRPLLYGTGGGDFGTKGQGFVPSNRVFV